MKRTVERTDTASAGAHNAATITTATATATATTSGAPQQQQQQDQFLECLRACQTHLSDELATSTPPSDPREAALLSLLSTLRLAVSL